MPKPPTTLLNALLEESSLRQVVKNGMGAVIAADRRLIAPELRTRIGDSLDLDAATIGVAPNDHRWDYVLSIPSKNLLLSLEPHSASNGEVKVVIKKKQNALAYLRGHLRPGYKVHEWHWVTRGRVGFSPMEKAVRALAEAGIAFGGKSLCI